MKELEDNKTIKNSAILLVFIRAKRKKIKVSPLNVPRGW